MKKLLALLLLLASTAAGQNVFVTNSATKAVNVILRDESGNYVAQNDVQTNPFERTPKGRRRYDLDELMQVQGGNVFVTNSATKAVNVILRDTSGDYVDASGGGGASISDTVYGGSWNGVTTIGASKNSLFDKIELLAPLASPTFTGTVTIPTGQTFTAPIIAAGSATAASKMKLTSGTVLTSPEAGALEYDGSNFYATTNTTQGRESWVTEARYLMTADGSVSGTATITDMFPANSSFSTVTNGIYEITFDVYYLKTTAGTMVFTITNSQNYTNLVASCTISGATGISTYVNPPHTAIVATTTAAAAFPATASLTTAVNHRVLIKVIAECGTAGTIRLRGTPSAGTFTTLRGSQYSVKRWTGNVGTFAP